MSIVGEIQESRVSSVLNNDRKLYGKKYLFDGKDETCWNSDKGSPQWIEFSFPAVKVIQKLSIQFQGGFAAKSFVLECIENETQCVDGASIKNFEFYPKDSNAAQTFTLPQPLSSKKFRLCFSASYDFYGRIIIYHLDVIGEGE